MKKYIVKRLLQLIPILIGITDVYKRQVLE